MKKNVKEAISKSTENVGTKIFDHQKANFNGERRKDKDLTG